MTEKKNMEEVLQEKKITSIKSVRDHIDSESVNVLCKARQEVNHNIYAKCSN